MNALTQSRRITICIFLVAAFVAAFALIAAQPSDVVANAESMSVTNSRGALHVNIPYHADHDGAGQPKSPSTSPGKPFTYARCPSIAPITRPPPTKR